MAENNANAAVQTSTQDIAREPSTARRYAPKDALDGKSKFKVYVVPSQNPKRGKCALRFQWYYDNKGASVADVINAGRAFSKGESTVAAPRKDDLLWDLAHGLIRLEDDAPKAE